MSLLVEIQKPEYAELIASNNLVELEALLTARNIDVPAPFTFITELGILDLLGASDGEIFLSALETAAESMPVLTRVIRWLRSEKGVDVGNVQVQTMLDDLV